MLIKIIAIAITHHTSQATLHIVWYCVISVILTPVPGDSGDHVWCQHSRWLWQDQADPCCRGWWLWWVQEPSPWLWKLIVKPMDRFTALDNPPRHSVFTTIYFTCQSNKWILNFASPDPRPASKTFLLCEDNFEFQLRIIDKFSNSLEFEQVP